MQEVKDHIRKRPQNRSEVWRKTGKLKEEKLGSLVLESDIQWRMFHSHLAPSLQTETHPVAVYEDPLHEHGTYPLSSHS